MNIEASQNEEKTYLSVNEKKINQEIIVSESNVDELEKGTGEKKK